MYIDHRLSQILHEKLISNDDIIICSTLVYSLNQLNHPLIFNNSISLFMIIAILSIKFRKYTPNNLLHSFLRESGGGRRKDVGAASTSLSEKANIREPGDAAIHLRCIIYRKDRKILSWGMIMRFVRWRTILPARVWRKHIFQQWFFHAAK